MSLKLSRPLAFFDLETTGLDISKDRIVEISILKVFPDHHRESKYYLINPEILIPKEVSDIHGITNEKVENAPKFADVASEIFAFLEDSDFAGFNSNRFDIPVLVEELLRCGYYIDLDKKAKVDVQNIFFKKEKRDLTAAYKFYCDKELVNAHSAEADTEATYEIFMAQLERYPDIIANVDYIDETFNDYQLHVDTGKRIMRRGNDFVLCFGKHKDKTFQEIFDLDRSYFKWMYGADFGLHTKIKLKEICDDMGIKVI